MGDTANATNARATDRRPLVRVWLAILAALIFAMVIVGGATRLTDSGLSITEWQPLLGAIPPLDARHWDDAFALYRGTTEYKLVNTGMTLAEFKQIYWWEWAHRFLGRFIGVAFLLPFLGFLAAGALDRRSAWRIVPLFLLGGLQGAIGWWMVRSGLADRVDVAPIRLAVHLTLACLIFALAVWLAVRADEGAAANRRPMPARLPWALVAGVLAQIFLGGLVAGLDAGLSFNTWPLMDGRLVPSDLLLIEPWWRNLLENAKAVQFVHRWFAAAVVCVAMLTALGLFRRGRRTLAAMLVVVVAAQFALGIATLLAAVPIGLALAHQGMALVLLALAVAAAARPYSSLSAGEISTSSGVPVPAVAPPAATIRSAWG